MPNAAPQWMRLAIFLALILTLVLVLSGWIFGSVDAPFPADPVVVFEGVA